MAKDWRQDVFKFPKSFLLWHSMPIVNCKLSSS